MNLLDTDPSEPWQGLFLANTHHRCVRDNLAYSYDPILDPYQGTTLLGSLMSRASKNRILKAGVEIMIGHNPVASNFTVAKRTKWTADPLESFRLRGSIESPEMVVPVTTVEIISFAARSPTVVKCHFRFVCSGSVPSVIRVR